MSNDAEARPDIDERRAGKIRDAESDGCYRLPLLLRAEKPEPALITVDNAECPCGAEGIDLMFTTLVDLMCSYKGFESTEDPIRWVRSLMRKLDEGRENNTLALRPSTDLTELSRELDEWLEERTDRE